MGFVTRNIKIENSLHISPEIDTILNDADVLTDNDSDLATSKVIKRSIDDVEILSLWSLSTGLISGGTLSINSLDNTQFDIAPLKGVIIDQYTDPETPTKTIVEFSGATGVAPTFLTTQQVTYISIDENLNIIQTASPLTAEQRRDYIEIGIVIHNNLTNINDFNNSPTTVTDVSANLHDLKDVIGLIRYDEGNKLQPTTSLQFNKTAGLIFKHSSNYELNIKSPNIKSIPTASPAQFFYRRADGVTGGVTNTVVTNEWEEIDGLGNSTIQTISGSGSEATVQRVILFESGKIVIQRGQAVYETLQQAANTFLKEDFKYDTNVLEDGLLLGAIVITVNCTNTSDISRCIFIGTDHYGSLLGGGNTGYLDLNKNVIVRSLSDLPDPDINGIITLKDSFTYFINGIVNIGNNVLSVGDNSVIKGRNPSNDIILGDNDAYMIIGTNKSVLIDFVGFINVDNDGYIFNLEGNFATQLVMQNSYILGNSNAGRLSGYNFIYLNTMLLQDIRNGFDIEGGDNKDEPVSLFVTTNYILSQSTAGNTIFNITDGFFSTIKFWDNNVRISDGNTFLNVDTNNIDPEFGTIVNGLIFTNEFRVAVGGNILSGITKKSAGWFVTNNRGLEDSVIQGFIEFVNNTTTTTVASTAVWYKVAGTNSGNTQGERVGVATNNRLTYICDCKPIFESQILVSGSLFTTGNNQTLGIAIYKNNAIYSQISVLAPRSGEPVNFSILQVDQTSVNDFYEIFVRNFTSTNNITLQTLQFKLLGKI